MKIMMQKTLSSNQSIQLNEILTEALNTFNENIPTKRPWSRTSTVTAESDETPLPPTQQNQLPSQSPNEQTGKLKIRNKRQKK